MNDIKTPRLINTKKVLNLIGISSYNTLRKRITEKGFPKPIKENRRLFWVEHEVIEYLKTYIEENERVER